MSLEELAKIEQRLQEELSKKKKGTKGTFSSIFLKKEVNARLEKLFQS